MKQRSEKENKVAVLGLIAVMVSAMLLASMPMATAKLYGDANGDGVIDEEDTTYVWQIIAGEKPKNELADANQDGEIDARDATYIAGIISGDNPFPGGTLIAGLGRDPGKQYGYGAHPSLTGVYEQLVWIDYGMLWIQE